MSYTSVNASGNSITGKYRTLSRREQLIQMVVRDIKRVGHNRGIQDPIADFLKEYNELIDGQITSIDQIDEVSLEGIHNSLATSIHEICEDIKRKSENALAIQ